jgi:hypothetical protein
MFCLAGFNMSCLFAGLRSQCEFLMVLAGFSLVDGPPQNIFLLPQGIFPNSKLA